MLSFKPWLPLSPGAVVDLIAPAGAVTTSMLEKIELLLRNWGLIPRVAKDLVGKDILCSNTDETRFFHLKEALLSPTSDAIWCIRGGYGCARLIDQLALISPPLRNKLLIGFSDITVLHLFLQKNWGWQTVYGPSAHQVAEKKIDEIHQNELKSLLFGKSTHLTFPLSPLNFVHKNKLIPTTLTGGTLSLIQTSIGTSWEVDTNEKILVIEEVNERAYRVDRMLKHLEQAELFVGVKGVIFGDFVKGEEPNGSSLIKPVLERFAQEQSFPVFHLPNIGHGQSNRALPFGASAVVNTTKNELIIKI